MQVHCVAFAISIVSATALLCAAAESPKYLMEAPSFLKPCRLQADDHGACLAKTLESIFQHWRGGVPGLRSVGPLEPFRVRRVRIAQHLPNVDVEAELRNMTTHGLSQAKVLNSTTLVSDGQYTMGFHVRMPRIVIDTKYKLKGHVLVLNLNSNGSLKAELDNLEFYVALKTRPKQLDGITFVDVSAVKTDIARIDKIRLHFSNLFGGNEPLERSANELFNDNWRVLFDLLRPVLTQTYDSVLLNRFAKIFAYVPAKFIFEDFE